MKNAKKHFSRALTLLLSVLFIFQSVSVPAFAAENPTENIETTVENILVEEDSTFTLANANVQISDEYGNETDYISEVQIPDTKDLLSMQNLALGFILKQNVRSMRYNSI